MADRTIDAPGSTAADRREPGTKVPLPLTTGLGLQIMVLALPGSVLMPTVVFQSAGQPEDVLVWAVFASVAACGVTTMLQALRVGRFGAGYIVVAGTTGVAIATSVSALAAGGPALLGALVIALALFQFVFSTRLSLFRRVLTPTVTGTVMMLTPVTVMPIIFQQLQNVPAGTPHAAAILSALTTLLVTAGIVLKAGPSPRLWAPIVGNRRRLGRWGGFRPLRLCAYRPGFVARRSGGPVAGPGPRFRTRFLDASSRLSCSSPWSARSRR